MKRKVFISGKYTGVDKADTEKNIEIAKEVGQKIMAMGYIPFIPHTMYNLWDFETETPYENFMEATLAFLWDCDIVFAIPGWQDSEGAKKEITLAKELCLAVVYSPEELEVYRETLKYPMIGSAFSYGGKGVIVTKRAENEMGEPVVMFRELGDCEGMYAPLELFCARAKRIKV